VAAKQWDARGRSPGLLWRGETLDEARRFHARYVGELAERERAFMTAALGYEARAARRRRTVVAVFVALLCAGAVGATIALITIRRAQSNAQEKAEAAERSATRAYAAEANVKQQLERAQAAERSRQEAETQAARSGAEVKMTQAELEEAYERVRN